jgi:hypothetical protein
MSLDNFLSLKLHVVDLFEIYLSYPVMQLPFRRVYAKLSFFHQFFPHLLRIVLFIIVCEFHIISLSLQLHPLFQNKHQSLVPSSNFLVEKNLLLHKLLVSCGFGL